jgi:hypothetical protein
MRWTREDIDDLYDFIVGEVREAFEGARLRRFGAYTARATGVARTFRRLQVSADWYPEGALDYARRVASPILDVIATGDTYMAVTSHDGVPELPLVLGQVWDERVKAMTVWVRAYLDAHPGRLEVGALKSLLLRVGTDSGWEGGEERAAMREDVPDGAAVIESDDVRLGAVDAADFVALASKVEAELDALWTAMNTHVHTSAAPGVPTGPAITPPSGTTPPAPPSGAGALPSGAGAVGATRVKAK